MLREIKLLEQFKVQVEDEIRIDESKLRNLVSALFVKAGLSKDDADLGADVLVTADIRGVDTHGVSNMLRTYMDYFSKGIINPDPKTVITRETPSTANIDGDRGLGIITTPKISYNIIKNTRKNKKIA